MPPRRPTGETTRKRNPARDPRPPAAEYRTKAAHEAADAAWRASRSGGPEPSGDPLSGIMAVVEPAASTGGNAKLASALRRSFSAIGLDGAYVTPARPETLLEELLSLEPAVLVAVGPGAARAVDASGYPLA